jgi:uncharacterized protein (TIGR02118 family)
VADDEAKEEIKSSNPTWSYTAAYAWHVHTKMFLELQFQCSYTHFQGDLMAGVKLVVMYPRPKDIDAFEKVYQSEHVPMAVEKLKGKTKFVATKVTGSPQGTAPFYRIAEVHFPSMEALQSCAASEGGKETIGHAVKISSGGPPVMMIAEEESFNF